MTNVKYLVLVRHGESVWNKENRFTGWTDVELSPEGEIEAREAGKMIKKSNIKFDIVFTSVLKRAIFTTWEILKYTEQQYLPIINSWRLNERHYGSLQGLNKTETAEKHGEAQVKIWRRAYDVAPPPLKKSDPRWGGNGHACFTHIPTECLPVTECLKDTVARVLPFFFDNICPALANGKNVLVSAHGNSLRALVKHLDNMSDEEVIDLNIPTAAPLVYELDDNFKPVKKYYLLDDADLKAKIAAVANQGKAR